MKIRKSELVRLIHEVLEEEFSALSLQDEISHLTHEIDTAAHSNDLPTLLKMYKELGGTIQKASKQMRIGS